MGGKKTDLRIGWVTARPAAANRLKRFAPRKRRPSLNAMPEQTRMFGSKLANNLKAVQAANSSQKLRNLMGGEQYLERRSDSIREQLDGEFEICCDV